MARGALAVAALLLVLAAGAYATKGLWIERLPPSWRIALSAWRHGVAIERDVAIAMPDGARLVATLYRPRAASGRLPTVLIRLPYGRERYVEGYAWAIFFASHGYAALVQDLRGSGDSQGELLPWKDAASDGAATLDWIARQAWSDGKVGTFGCSALGETQFALARRGEKAHRAMIASGAGGAVGSAANRHSYFGVFEGGVFELASGFGWFVEHGAKDPRAPALGPIDRESVLRRLPIAGLVQSVRPGPNGFDDFVATPLGDPRWSEWGYLDASDRLRVPVLAINTWGDQTVGDALALAESWRRADPEAAAKQKVVIAPGGHCGHDDAQAWRRFGEIAVENAQRPYEDWYLRWFAYWLKGEGDGLAHLAPYNYFMLGENRWLAAAEWPPREASVTRFHLASGGHANSVKGDGTLSRVRGAGPADRYDYDPMNPVPTRGGPICCTGNPANVAGPADQADVESRADVLVYTSAPLEQDLRIAGPLKAHVTVSSSVPDTDLVARLVDVRPDGRAIGIQEGALRLRYREGFAAPRMMEPGRRYEADIDMRSIAYRIARGHRLRLDITSSSFPRLERNLNTGAANNALEARGVVAQVAIHHDAEGPSYLELPLLPAAP